MIGARPPFRPERLVLPYDVARALDPDKTQRVVQLYLRVKARASQQEHRRARRRKRRARRAAQRRNRH